MSHGNAQVDIEGFGLQFTHQIEGNIIPDGFGDVIAQEVTEIVFGDAVIVTGFN
jgi:hypothetical protein